MNTLNGNAWQVRNALHLRDLRTPRSRRFVGVHCIGLGFVALFSVSQAGLTLAATAPNLGSTSTYGIVSSTFTNSNTAPQTIINGDVCYTTGPVTPPLTIVGATASPCPPVTGNDQGLALANLNGQA